MSQERRAPSAAPAPAAGGDAGTLGLCLFLASLGMLFAASLVAYAVIRSRHQPWPPPGLPALPGSLWLSTLVILSAEVTIQRAWSAARRGADAVLHEGSGSLRQFRDDSCPVRQHHFGCGPAALRRHLFLTLVLGLLFLGLQAWAWWQIWGQVTAAQPAGPYVKLFYMLTGLHAAHVLGGVGPLAVVLCRARAGVYGPGYHPGVRYCALYWHFLGAVWCVLFVAIYLV